MEKRKLVAIHLYGDLADKFGARHDYGIRNPAEAVRALCANYPDFRGAFLQHERYAILADGDWRDGSDGADLPVSREVHIVPHIAGQAPLIAPFVAGALGTGIVGTIATQLISGILVSALLWGVSQLFAKPKEVSADDTKSESYIFTGANNTAVQGAAVPVIYGRNYVGSVVISAGLSVGDQQITTQSAQLLAREKVPLTPDAQMLQNDGVPDAPRIILQNVSTNPDEPTFRLGPEGWIMVGVVAMLEGEQMRTVEVWIPPEAGHPYKWDYMRGFHRYLPGEAGFIEP